MLSEQTLLAVGLLLIFKSALGVIVTVPVFEIVPQRPFNVTVIISLILKVTAPNVLPGNNFFFPIAGVLLSMMIVSNEPVTFVIYLVSSSILISTQSLILKSNLKSGLAKTSIFMGNAIGTDAQSFVTISLR